jgi:hypothetical protein
VPNTLRPRSRLSLQQQLPSSSGAHYGASLPKRSAGKILAILRCGHGDVAPVIQHSPPPPMPPLLLPMRTRAPSNGGGGGGFTGRQPVTSVSSSARDLLPKSATPSDKPDQRSFPHSVITPADDPFAGREGPLAPKPSQLSAHSALFGKRPHERKLRELRAVATRLSPQGSGRRWMSPGHDSDTKC